MRKTFLIAAAAMLALTACVSKDKYEKELAQVQLISAEKDSLLKDVMATTQFIADVNTELGKVRDAKAGKPVMGASGELPNASPAEQRAHMIERVKQLTNRVNEAESRLAASRQRVAALSGDNSALQKQLAQYDSTITAFKSIIENQKAEIASLSAQVGALQGENVTLKTEKAQLTTEKESLTTEKAALTTERNTVYYVIGTKDELRKKGIIVKKGGILGIAATDIPATTLNPADFTSIDKTKVSAITLPKADKSYRVLSRQDLSATAQPAKGGYKGTINITNAEQFWAASKYLIIVQN
ncbi:MAG: Cbp1 family collagen-binding glycoprotein adhesin [Gemmatimonadaceae bacterium]